MLPARCGLLLKRASCCPSQLKSCQNAAKIHSLIVSSSSGHLPSLINNSKAKNIEKPMIFRMLNTTLPDHFSNKSSDEMTLIGKDEVDYIEFEKFRNNDDALLIDVRNPEELLANGAIPKAINIPLPDIPKYFFGEDSSFEERFDMPLPKKTDPIIVFCKIGKRSETARQLLSSGSGTTSFSNVANYKGSFDDWIEKNSSK